VTATTLASIYTGLSEILAPPGEDNSPGWVLLPGKEWPLFKAAVGLASQQKRSSQLMRNAVRKLADVPARCKYEHLERYKKLFNGREGPIIWLYESKHINGRIPGPATFVVQSLYTQTGLEIVGAELADHASLELAFLAFLAENECNNQEESLIWAEARELFIKKHAGRWLPAVGKGLMQTAYPFWIAVGSLLIAVLHKTRKKAVRGSGSVVRKVPTLLDTKSCSLCGFCMQTCPTQALRITEDISKTELRLKPALCIDCGKCIHICPDKLIHMEDADLSNNETVILRDSTRLKCPQCGGSTVSQAELETITARLGSKPEWLTYCVDCRQTY
jgi:TorA maturation chaperone TorD/Fe-S-cluster-containing hydrogenase component 2